jgi:hypothetical protein
MKIATKNSIDIFTNLRKCCLQLDNFKKLIFMNKIWSNDSKVGCKALSNLVELIEIDKDL